MAANIKLSVNLEAAQATQLASQLGTALAQASVNSHEIQVNPLPIKAAKGEAVQLEQVLREIQMSIERLNISLAKTAKLSFELNRGKGALSGNKKDALAQLDDMIAKSQAALEELKNNLNNSLQSAQPVAEKTGDEIQKVGKKAEKTGAIGKGAFKGITSAMKTNMTTAQALARSFFSPITIAIIAFEAVVKTFTYFWDNLTESTQKMTIRNQALIKSLHNSQKKLDDKAKTTKELVDKLEQLNKAQSLNTVEQTLAESIVSRLNREYKDLGITLDQTTGKYDGLYQAQKKIDDQQRRETERNIKNEISAQRDLINASLVKTFGRGIQLDKTVNGKDFFGIAEALGGTLGYENSDILAKKWNTKDLKKQIEVIKQLIQGLSSSDMVVKNAPEALENMQRLVDLQQQLNSFNDVSNKIYQNNLTLLQKVRGVIQDINDLNDKTNETLQQIAKSQEESYYNSLQTNEDKADFLRQRLTTLQEDSDKTYRKIEQAQGQFSNSQHLEQMAKTNIKTMQQQVEVFKQSLDQIDKKIQVQKKAFKDEHGYSLEDLNSQIDQARKNRDSYPYQAAQKWYDWDKQVKRLKAIKDSAKEITDLQMSRKSISKQKEQVEHSIEQQLGIQNKAIEDRLNAQKELVELQSEHAQKQLQIQEKTTQLSQLDNELAQERLKIEQQREELLQKQQQAIEDITSSYQKQLEAYNKTPLQQKIESALQNAEKSKGAELTREEIDNIVFYVTQLERINQLEKERQELKRQQDAIEGIFTKYQQNQSVQFLKMVGKQKEAVLLEAKLNAQKAKGAALTEKEVEALKGYLEVEEKMNQFNDNKDLNIDTRRNEVISNDLAKKGGWASSVVVDRSVDVNEQILSVQKNQEKLMSDIKDMVDRYSVIQ